MKLVLLYHITSGKSIHLTDQKRTYKMSAFGDFNLFNKEINDIVVRNYICKYNGND